MVLGPDLSEIMMELRWCFTECSGTMQRHGWMASGLATEFCKNTAVMSHERSTASVLPSSRKFLLEPTSECLGAHELLKYMYQ